MKKSILKISFLILAIIFALSICCYADMDAPGVKPYTVTVKDPNGLDTYEYVYDETTETSSYEKSNYKIPEGTKITIQYEFEFDEVENAQYASCYVGNHEKDYTILLSDIETITEPFSKYQKDVKYDAEVLAKSGVKMYIGPSYKYELEGTTIPKGEKITMYAIDDESSYSIPWYYVTYNGHSGWINFLNGAVGYVDTERSEENNTYLTMNNIYLYSDLSNIENPGFYVIPANTYVTLKYSIDPWSRGFYTNYEGIEGYISYYEDVASTTYEGNKEGTVNYIGAKLYKTASVESEAICDLNLDDKLTINYCGDDYALAWDNVTLEDGTTGWFLYALTEQDYNENKDAYSGAPEISDEQMEEINQKYLASLNNEDENTTSIENTVVETNETTNTVSNSTNPVMQNVVIYVLMAVIIALLVVIIILLVNKKK